MELNTKVSNHQILEHLKFWIHQHFSPEMKNLALEKYIEVEKRIKRDEEQIGRLVKFLNN